MLVIKVLDDPHYKRRENIAGTEYVLVIDYRTRQQGWFLEIQDQDEDPIRRGMRLTPGWNPLFRAKDERLPPGEFYLSSTLDPITRDGFVNGDALFVYFTPAEVAEFAATLGATQPTLIFS
jgi:hypothetical protein